MLRAALIALLLIAAPARAADPVSAGDDVLRIGLRGPLLQRDPQLASSPDEGVVIRALYRGLMRDDARGLPVPDLVQEIDSAADGLTHRLRLGAAHWSDGRPVTATDAVASLRRLADAALASPHRHLLADLALAQAGAVLAGDLPPDALGVQAQGDDLLVLTTTRPVPDLAALLAHPALAPLPAHAPGDWGVTSGPYRVDAGAAGVTLRLIRAPGADPAMPAVIEAHSPTDWPAAIDAFAAGGFDILPLPGAHLAAARARFGAQAVSVPLACTWGYVVNLTDSAPPALRDPAIRRALSLALDRRQIIDTVLGDGQQPALGWVPPALAPAAVAAADADRPQAERMAEAEQILADAGYDAERPLLLRVASHTDPDARRLLDALQYYWRPLNVIVRADEVGWDAHARRVAAGDFGLASFGWCADWRDAAAFQQVFGPDGADPGGFANPDYRALLALAQTRQGPSRAAAQSAANAVLDRELPVIALFHYAAPVLVSDRVRGFATSNPMGRWYPQDIRLAPQ
ncbi:ABC transporter substrate-binding protein [Paracoccus jiaweipingae]|uniref:ABC transporter substrate-binding protein n=1 Tax=unclassified Paracoccus (in: a-proteobacteria) TaxID=2688777 RepID=UPI0037895140